MTNGLKRCTKCGEEYPATVEHFVKNKKCTDGLGSWCKRCQREYARTRYEADPEKAKAQNRAWCEANADKVKARHRAWYKANSEKVKAQVREWCASNPEKAKAKVRNRQARVRNAEGSHTAADIQLQLKTQTDKNGVLRCWWCNKKLGTIYQVDHRFSVARGGSNGPDNLCISCPSCNMSKGAKMPWEFNGRLL